MILVKKNSKIKVFIILIVAAFVIVFSCQHYTSQKENPLARVYDEYLYKSEIKDLVNEGVSPEDSVMIVHNYIDMWIRNQLMLKKAEQNLSEEQKDVKRQLQDYRAKLLIYKYKQQWIKEKLDTLVNYEEIREYYNSYSSNFVLKENIVKALYIKIPKNSPNIEKVSRWVKSEAKKDQDLLESYCYKFSTTYDTFDSSWVAFKDLLNSTPIRIKDQVNFLKKRNYIEGEDEDNRYYIKINDFRLRSKIAPLNYVQNDIRQIIVNKRKHKLIEDLENNIYSDALNYESFKIYNKEVKKDTNIQTVE